MPPVRDAPGASGMAITGLGVRLASAGDPWDLAAGLGFASRSDPVRPIAADVPEAERALSAVAAAVGASGLPGDGRTGVVWSTATAGLAEYQQILAEIAEVGPSRVSPGRAARSAFTGPATAVSIALGADGPCLTLTGTRDAAGHAVAEAVRMLERDECVHVVVGGSVRPAAEPGSAAGAMCVVLSRATGTERPAAVVRPLARARVGDDVPAFAADCLQRAHGAPERVLVSAAPRRAALADLARHLRPVPCTWIEERLGDLGALGGLAAVAGIAALHNAEPDRGEAPMIVLALGAGNAVAIEITPGGRRPRCD